MNCFLPAQNMKILVKSIYAMAKLPGEELYLEAFKHGLSLRTVNSSRSGYLCFLFKPEFFISWTPASVESIDETRRDDDEDRTSGNHCKISMKSALIVYKAVLTLEKSIESCSISIDVDDWKLIFELQCKSGVIRKYKLVLLNCVNMQATFDKKFSKHVVTVPGKLFVEGIQQNFHSGQDEVTMSVDFSELNLRSYVDDAPQPEKVLKTQLHMSKDEFEQFLVQANVDITFCLKELRAFLSFVEAYQLPVVVRFDQGGKPIIFSIECDPAFVTDLVLATFMEPEDSQTPSGTEDQRAASLRQGSQLSSQPIVNVGSDHGSASSRDSQLRYYGSGPRRVSALATAVVSQSSKSSARKSDQTNTNTTGSVDVVEERPAVSLSDRPSAQAASVSRSNENNMNVNQENGTASTDDTYGIQTGEQFYTSPPETPKSPPTTPPAKRIRQTLFANWSQSTTATNSQLSIDHDEGASDRIILAPDSDMEDY